MAQPYAYYKSEDAVIYPSTNATDSGKLNIEDNVKDIVTRITNRNYVLNAGDFTISATTVDGIPKIAITSGQCNIAGYHIVTTTSLYLGVPESASVSPYYVGLKLAKDRSNHVLGDVTEGGVTLLNGVWASYFTEAQIANDPELLVLGSVVWNGSSFTTVNPSQDITTRINGDMIRVDINDPKHPAIDYLNLQELVYYLPDWYVSKLGDDIFGDLYFRIPGDTVNYGIVGTLESNSSSKIIVKPNNKTDSAYRAILGANGTHPYLQLGTAAMIDYATNMGIYSPTGINVTANNGDLDMLAKNHIIFESSYRDTELDIYNGIFEFSSPYYNDRKAGFSFNSSNTLFYLDNFMITHANSTNARTTITNDEDIQFNPFVILNGNARVNNILYINGTDSYLKGTEWKYVNGTLNVYTDSNGVRVTQSNSSAYGSPEFYVSKVGIGDSTLFPSELLLQARSSSGTASVYFGDNGDTYSNASYIRKVYGTKRLRTNGDFYADGNISAAKVYNAVYNDIAEFMEKEDYNEVIEPGDVVYFNESGKVSKYHEGINQTAIAGVVSSEETYGYALGGDGLEDNQKVPVALKGRVYVKTDNTGFKPGDFIAVDACGCVYKGDPHIYDNYVLGIATMPEKDGKVFMMIK